MPLPPPPSWYAQGVPFPPHLGSHGPLALLTVFGTPFGSFARAFSYSVGPLCWGSSILVDQLWFSPPLFVFASVVSRGTASVRSQVSIG